MDFPGLAQATVLSGMGVSLITEILKSKYIPVPAQKHPRLTAGILSLVTSIYEVYRYNQANAAALTWAGIVAITGFTLLVAALTYENIIH